MSYRTFVKLDPYERWILRVMQNMPKMLGKKRKKPSSKIIGAIIREYFEDLVENSDPEMLKKLLQMGPPCPVSNDIVNRKLKEVPPAGIGSAPTGG
jgi:hypothetical protein